MRLSSAVAGAALAAYAGAVCAQPTTPPSDTIVVTATRAPRTADETLSAVSVITRADIERRQAQDVVDLLRTEAGIDITRSGGPGGNVSLFMRGANSNHVLVLVDGVRVGSLTTGTFEWRNLPLALIERIEVVRGPRASLYGSDALGGVIQIFTRRPAGLEASVGAGSDQTYRAEVGAGTGGATRVFATASHFETEGFSAQNRRGFAFDPDDDGARRQALAAGFEADLGDAARVELIGRQTRGVAELDTFGSSESELESELVSARLAHALTPAWSQSLSLGLFRDRLATGSASDIRSRRRSLEWQHDVVLDARSLVTAGLSYLEESAASAGVFDAEQDSSAAFALWQRRFGAHDVQLAARYDDYSTFGGHGTWNAAYGWPLAPDARAWISYGTAFRAPSLNDLFHPGTGGFFAGNPDLEPERSRTAEVGIRQSLPAGHIAVSLFITRFDNLIAFQGVNFQAINVERASARGVELEHARRVGAWYFAHALTLLRARNETADQPLLRRADVKLSTLAERRFGRSAAALELVAASDRPDIDAMGARVNVAGYGIVNLIARHRLRRGLALQARLENLFDKEYQIVEGFNPQGRSVFVALSYQAAGE